jgi:hypothetical protein
MGWCKHFSRQMVSQFGGGISSGGGATFDQNFLGGSLGTGAVFTRASTGTYYDSAGVLRSAAINTPRFDYDPVTLQLKGLLLEDASTNIALQSANLANAAWLLAGQSLPVVTGNQLTAPDGTLTAARVVLPAVSGAGIFSIVYQNITLPAGVAAISFYLRGNAGGERVYITIAGWYGTPTILTTQWQRFVFITPSLSAAAYGIGLGTDLRDATQTSTPAQTIYAWGAQVEALPYMSSHIPTTSASVTRAADVLYYPIPGAVPGYNAINYSMLFDYDTMNTNTVVGGIANTFSDASYMGNNSFTVVGSTASVVNGVPPMTAGVRGVLCGALSPVTMAISANGGPVISGANGAPAQTGANKLVVGSASWSPGASGISGHMRRMSYWPRTLSNSEMQAATTLAGPTLSLDFMMPGTLDPRITFTRASSATYTDASGVIQTAATNAPRWDYAGGVLRGLLIEEARTNIAQFSEDFSNVAWLKASGGTSSSPVVTANQTVAPDGTTTADRIVYPACSGAGSNSVVGQAAGVTAAAYTHSIWLRGNVGGERLYLNTTPDGLTYYRAQVTLTTAWQRFSMTTSALSATIWYFQLGCDLRDASQTATSAQTIFAWGAQLEQGAFPTSYIPTTSVSVTRAADVAVMPTNVSWFNAAAGSLAAEFSCVNRPVGQGGIVRLDDGMDANAASVFVENTASIIFTYSQLASVAQINAAPGLLVANGAVQKSAFSYGGGPWKVATGGLVENGSGSAVPFNATRLIIGSSAAATNIWELNGTIRRVTYWNRALSNGEMQQVTT